jgi:hypothetical protein
MSTGKQLQTFRSSSPRSEEKEAALRGLSDSIYEDTAVFRNVDNYSSTRRNIYGDLNNREHVYDSPYSLARVY